MTTAVQSSLPLRVVHFQEIEKKLLGEIVRKIPMQDFLRQKGHTVHFTSQVFWVELNTKEQAVLKETSEYHAIAEVAAYRASTFLGFSFVPPTVLHVKNGVVASLQQYIEPAFDLGAENNYELALAKVSPEELANIDIFYFFLGQWDRGISNTIAAKIGQNIRLFLIDNAAMGTEQKVRYGDYPFVKLYHVTTQKKDEGPFPFDRVRALPPDREILSRELGNFLREKTITQLCQLRCPKIHFVIWKGHFWRQFRFGKPAATNLYPPRTMEALKKLDLHTVKQFFQNEIGFQYSPEFYADILERRDQVMKAYEQQLSSQKPPHGAVLV